MQSSALLLSPSFVFSEICDTQIPHVLSLQLSLSVASALKFIPEWKGSPSNINQAENLSLPWEISAHFLTLTPLTNRKTALLHFSALHTQQFYVLLLVLLFLVKITTRNRRRDWRDLKGKSIVPNPLLWLTRIQQVSCKCIQHGAS